MEALMTTDEVAAFLRVDVVTIRRLVSRGELAAYRVGGEFRFSQATLEEFLQRQYVPASGESGEGTALDTAARQKGSKNMDRFDRFTDQARQSLDLAQEEATSVQHSYIGTEHMLLGLLRTEAGIAAQVLSEMHVELEQARNSFLAIVGKGERPAHGQIGLNPRAKKVIELAVDEAKKLGHRYLSTGHLLLGMIREREGLGVGILMQLNVALETLRQETARVLTQTTLTREQEIVSIPAIPPEATALLSEDEQGLTCSRCSAHCPTYFRYCFNCGTALDHS